jgi:hypothetical protein
MSQGIHSAFVTTILTLKSNSVQRQFSDRLIQIKRHSRLEIHSKNKKIFIKKLFTLLSFWAGLHKCCWTNQGGPNPEAEVRSIVLHFGGSVVSAEAFDGSEDVISGLCPFEGFGVGVVVADEEIDVCA